MAARAPVFDVKRFAVHDGPGIRTTVFLQGCPLACPWCQNPEGRRDRPLPWQDPTRCLDCGACLGACPAGALVRTAEEGTVRIRARPEACTGCGACVAACPSRALDWDAREMGVDEALAAVESDRLFYERSGGGVTLSGGEPLVHPAFCTELIAACRDAGLHTAIETCLAVSPAALAAVLTGCDLLLCDLKAPDEERHRAWTGAPLAPVLANLERVCAGGVACTVRIPVVPGRTDDPATVAAIAALARAHHPTAAVELVPWNPLPAGKYARLGLPWPWPRAVLPEGRLAGLRAAAGCDQGS